MSPKYRNRYLESQRSIPLNPEIATALGGADEALVLQQLNYWLANPKIDNYRDGRFWVYNTYEKWQENFPWLSLSTIRRIIGRLEKEGIVLSTDKYNDAKTNRTKWYTIDEGRLGDFLDGKPSVDPGSRPAQNEQVDDPERTARPVQNEQVDCSNRTGLEVLNLNSSGHRLPETTPETTRDGAAAPVVPVTVAVATGHDEDQNLAGIFRRLGGTPGPTFLARAAHLRQTCDQERLVAVLERAVQQRRTFAGEGAFFEYLRGEVYALGLGGRIPLGR